MTQDQLIISRYINEDKNDTELLVDVLEGFGRQNKGYYFSDILDALKKKYGSGWNEQRARMSLKSASHKGYITEISFKGVTSYRIPPVLRRSATHHSGLDEKNRSLPLPRTPPSFEDRDSKKHIGAWASKQQSSTKLKVSQATQKDEMDVAEVDDLTQTSHTTTPFLTHDKNSAKDTSDEDSLPSSNKDSPSKESDGDAEQNAENHNGTADMTDDQHDDFHEEFAQFKDYIKLELENLSKKFGDRGVAVMHARQGDANGWEPNLFLPPKSGNDQRETAEAGDNALETRLAATNDGVLIGLYQQRIKSLELELRKKQEVIDFLIGLVDSKTRSSRAKMNCHRMSNKGVVTTHPSST